MSSLANTPDRRAGGGNGFKGIQKFRSSYEDITSIEYLLAAWRGFAKGKRGKLDVAAYELRLMDNLFRLSQSLAARTYRHGPYRAFVVQDPKRRDIHKAPVRDRVLHHVLYNALYPYFDARFIHDSYSCRVGKGTHRALDRFRSFGRSVSRNDTRTVWVLKCDIKKFFASIDHTILKGILVHHIADADIRGLIRTVIDSFSSAASDKGVPLGNLTSQLLVNVYMNEFDQFMKRILKATYYIRYADDFVILSPTRTDLDAMLPKIRGFLMDRLKLELYPTKVSIRTLASGVDFLGWVHFPDHRVLRTVTRRRMLRNLAQPDEARINSYHGLLSHGNAFSLAKKIPESARNDKVEGWSRK